MSKRFIVTCGITCALSVTGVAAQPAASAQAPVPNLPLGDSVAKPLVVTYPDGSMEKYEIVYHANTRTSLARTGSAAKPLQGKFIDDRRCSWTISSNVTKQLFLVNHAGDKFEQGGPVVVTDSTTGGQSKGFSLTRLQGQTCGDVAGQIKADEANAKSKVMGALPDIVSQDLTKSLEELKATLPASTVKLGQ